MEPYVATAAGADLYRIVYRGEPSVSSERILDFALAHASHLADREGERYFAVIDEEKSRDTEVYYYESAEALENLRARKSLLIQTFSHRPPRIPCFRATHTANVVYEKYGLNRRPETL